MHRLLFLVALGLAQVPAHAMRIVWSEEALAGNMKCFLMLAEMARGPGARTNLQIRYGALNGNGLSEAAGHMMHFNYHLPTILQHAYEAGTFTAAELEVLKKIFFALGHERRLENLHFISEAANPEAFREAGENRLAATGSEVGTPILINTDRLTATSAAEKIGLLVHEFGHHQKLPDDERRTLDTLGAKVAASIRLQEQALEIEGFEHFQLTRFDLELAQMRATSFDEATGLTPPHMNDFGYGTHMILSDGIRSHDLRDMGRQYFEQGLDDQIVSMRIEPKSWRFEEREGIPVLVAKMTMNRQVIRPVDNLSYEFLMPLARDAQGTWRFQGDAEFRPAVKRIDYRETDLATLTWLWRQTGPIASGRSVAEDLVLARGEDGRYHLSFVAELSPGFRTKSQIDLLFVQEVARENGTVFRSMIRWNHSIARYLSGHYAMEEIQPGRFKISLTLPEGAPFEADSLKLASMLLRTNGDEVIVITPEALPTIHPREPRPAVIPTLRPEVRELNLPIRRSDLQLRDDGLVGFFDLSVEVPKDFDIEWGYDSWTKNMSELQGIFSDADQDHSRGYVSFGMPIYSHSLVRFRPEHGEIVEEGGRRWLKLKVYYRLYYAIFPSDWQPFNFSAPEGLHLQGFILRDAKFRTWEIPLNLRMEFLHE